MEALAYTFLLVATLVIIFWLSFFEKRLRFPLKK